MNDIMMYGSALIAVIIVVIMLIKKMDIKITLFAMGIVLMYIASPWGIQSQSRNLNQPVLLYWIR